ncbi:MAG: tRNA (adenosine(37)-N6)-threonylcarbamoyltransferase complex transferase subunit TsaD [Calditrichaeota bacterium]|nr:MAG: tRNA (adenosine(37)-N6)-threonylcarbamoyltransferase complex transferase subunit TsaD [Calditrichota bacterium]MBL1204271.1 tRNA (adenosine(37)-N6)-threonylcarbamoyltransferase complex transferase subunit TsaD [Calditrichota bacterium]NOG44101.1 tRNA (adenosine(37)-N6)-threonylcarbamoyltransferase complex transferase subunit TsaD [Calditrichota bacterium]
MKILAVETSCDETSAAVIEENNVLSNIISSQIVHSQFGGVVPELASRAHLQLVVPVIKQALSSAATNLDDIDGLAVTKGPGLVGALLVGLNFVKGLALSLNKPFIGINHMEGHIYGNLLTQENIKFPILFLIVSGGHTMLVLMKDHLKYEILGTTRDDAVGEAFDKTAKILGLGYPGGPIIDSLAEKGDQEFVRFPKAFYKEDHFDFSFSGLKTAVLTYKNKNSESFVKENMASICAAFRFAAIDVLVAKAIRAAKKYNAKSIGVAGGVAANLLLRRMLGEEAGKAGLIYYQPKFEYCTDNAAMIGRTALEYLKKNKQSDQGLNAYPSLKLTSIE